MTSKNCSICNTKFVCAADQTDQLCWCSDLPGIVPIDDSASCQCPSCLKQTIVVQIDKAMQQLNIDDKLALAAPYANQRELVQDIDFTMENGNYVFSAWFHLKRGTCCGSGCRNCPYDQS